jgi:cation transport ATPase
MKKVFLTLALAAGISVAVMAEKQTVRLYVPEMECDNCKGKVENVLAYEKGVKKQQQATPRRDTARRVRKNSCNTKNSHDIQTKRTRHTVSLQRDIKTNTKNIATQCQVGIKTKIPHRALWGIALKNVFYFTKTFLPLIM